jgi:polar amino acid transport system substrate-binding protein
LEEATVKLTARLAGLAAIAIVAAACGPGGGASSAPSVTATEGASAPPASVAATEVAIPPPTSLIKAGTLTDCVDIEYPPMEFFPSTDVTDPNQAVGFDVDGAKAVADRLGLAITIRNTAFDALIPDLQAGRCDIVWSALYKSDDRLQVADAVPYMTTGHVVMVKAGNAAGISGQDDLCGKTISIQSGGLVEKDSAAASKTCTDAGKPAIRIQGYKLVSDELQQLVLGRVDAVWETDSAVSDWILKHPGEYEVAFAFPPDKVYAVYYAKGKADVGTAIAAALAALKADGTLDALALQYQIDPATLDAIGT